LFRIVDAESVSATEQQAILKRLQQIAVLLNQAK
jgi:hypothetical protein